jgi:hypothetical protein
VPSRFAFARATCPLTEAFAGVSSCTYPRSSVAGRSECIFSRYCTTAIS